jgi:hypothetical protein
MILNRVKGLVFYSFDSLYIIKNFYDIQRIKCSFLGNKNMWPRGFSSVGSFYANKTYVSTRT